MGSSIFGNRTGSNAGTSAGANTIAKTATGSVAAFANHATAEKIAGEKIGAANMAASASAFPTRYVRFGAFQLDTERQDLLKNGARLRLPGKVCQVLTTLLERPGEIVTREELRARLWPSDTHVNFDANVNTTVNKLRQILCSSDSDASGFGAAGKPRGANGSSAAAGEPDDFVYVQTIPRKGYSFVSKVEFVDRVDSAGAPGDSAEAAEENSVATGSAESPRVFGAPTTRFFAAHRAPVFFTAGVIALVVAAMLFGAAITLFANRGF
jgi:DNA-binding winged helix-turn-helix (wHTH) protein